MDSPKAESIVSSTEKNDLPLRVEAPEMIENFGPMPGMRPMGMPPVGW
jgi:hypothetical protein